MVRKGAPPESIPLTSGAIGRILGWSTERTSRWLDGLAKQEPSILTIVNGRRYTTIASLRRVCPDIAARFASSVDLSDVREEQGELARDVAFLAKEIGAVKRALAGLEVEVRRVRGLRRV